jgi:hypothetical protein
MKIKVRLEDGTIIERTPYGHVLGNFSMLSVRYKNCFYCVNEGDEYLRGYPNIFTLRYPLKWKPRSL